MFRYLVVPVLMALLLVPDWASALGRRRPLFAARAQPVAASYPVQYAPPVYYPAPAPVVYYPAASAPCCPPACMAAGPAAAPANPSVVPERMEPTPKPKGNVQSEPLAQPKAVGTEPSLKPVSGETLPAMKDPIPVVPVPKPKETEFVPVAPAPKPKAVDEPLPPLKVDFNPAKKDEPKKPEPKEELPKLEFPKLDVPSIPGLDEPPPSKPLPLPNVVKSSPLNAEPAKLKIDRFAVEGAAPASADSLRLVTFYNFSARELTLTVAGKELVVPSRHRVEAKLSATFAWKIGDEAQPEGSIPVAAAGLDVVIGK